MEIIIVKKKIIKYSMSILFLPSLKIIFFVLCYILKVFYLKEKYLNELKSYFYSFVIVVVVVFEFLKKNVNDK